MSSQLLGPEYYIARRGPARVGVVLIGLALCLGGCAALPSSGPDINQVMKASKGPSPAFRIVDLTSLSEREIASATKPATLDELDRTVPNSPPLAVNQIEVDDTLQITVFEVGASLFTSGGSSSSASPMPGPPAANAATLPAMKVGPDGDVSVPYIGRVKVAGRTPDEVAAEIEVALHGKSQSPQVVVTVREDLGNTVILIGDLKNPGRKPLNYNRERLLDMIAVAGGPTNPKPDTIVRVTRGGGSVEMRLGDVVSGSPDDIPLRPQDRVELIYRPRTFTAFGATGKVSEIAFQADQLSLAEALARIGGPIDQQADSSGVFIFSARQPAGVMPVVYRLNLKDPRGFFIAQKFEIQDKDLILVANSESNSWYKFLGIVNSIINPVVTAKYLGV